MDTRRLLGAVALILFVAFNAWLIWRAPRGLHSGRDHSQAMQRAEERQRRRLAWEEFTVTPLNVSGLAARLATLAPSRDPSPPEGSTPLSPADLSDELRGDLFQGLAEMLAAYQQDDPQPVLDAMRRRGMVVNPERCAVLRRNLVEKRGHTWTEVDALSDDEVYATFWQATGKQSPLSGIVIPVSGLRLWQAGSVPPDQIVDMADFSRWVPQVWKGQCGYVSHFVPANGHSVQQAVRQDGTVLVADLELIIEHARSFDAKTPYLLRLWYNEPAARWQPLLLVQVLVGDLQPTRLMF